MDKHDLTEQLLASLANTVLSPDSFTFVIIDNGSDKPYKYTDYQGKYPFDVIVVRNPKNIGYYQPILQVEEMATDADIVGLIHNDVIIYEQGWDSRVTQSFATSPFVGMIGFVGSDQVDAIGGRGGGTMCFYRGEKGQSQAAGLRIHDLRPAIILDSVVMLMRAYVVPLLGVTTETPLCHFVDKVWPMRLFVAGHKTAVLGVEMDHIGGMTSTDDAFNVSAKEWATKHGQAEAEDPGMAVYLDAERRFLSEFRDERRMIPSRMYGWELING